MAFTQQDRFLRITKGPLDESEVILTGISGHEAMSRLYNFQLEFVSSKLDLKPVDLIGQPMTIELSRHDKDDSKLESRFINGYISRLSAGVVETAKNGTRHREYRAELVPWLWFLTQTARSYIFFPESEDKTIFKVIEEIFERAKEEYHIEPKVDLQGIKELNDRVVKHCVQYRETDFNFISRIMEQYGVFYYFTQKDGEHKLVLDMTKNYPQAVESKITYPANTGGMTLVDHITSWEHSYEFVSGKWMHTDYDFENPTTNLRKDSPAVSLEFPSASQYEVYDYPGEYTKPDEGKTDARVRQEEEEVPHDSVSVTSFCRTLMPGHTFELDGHPDGDVVSEHETPYLITSIQHRATQPGPDAGTGEVASYTNSFTCIPSSVQFRPARITPKPVVSGIQTAVVVGPKGEEIHTDEYGRIKVAFHWDREDDDRKKKPRKKVDNGEMFFCWVRVAQSIAGNKWGFMAIPRIGQEVVVDFIEGDPDRPLVIGSAYNQGQMPYYDPEEHKTKTYIKTNSSPGGEGFNELRFEDKKDKEQIFVHAERNMDVRVKNDSLERIYGNRHEIVGWEKDGDKGGSQKEEIKKDKDTKVHANQTEHIGGDMKLLVGGIDGDGNQDIVVKKDKKELIEGDAHLHVKGKSLEAIDGNRNTAVGGDQVLEVSGSSAHIAGADHLLKGMNISVEGQAICIKSGGNSITIDPSGVTIVGTLVRINSGPAPPVISQASMLQSMAPEDAEEAEPAEPSQADDSNTGAKSAPD
ncbi:Phage-related baseplate assembly protein [Planctomycetes bacterium CA13]|uniref:Phage-related baseplate assembly protein n=1 Tax=Novipirellula herctigrandis TaxID=2527986 RepID=A0A5C5Z4R3_9BACT|nr:Phage-related baseplate assembly protein [Planctomycetes bacterium CA13]